MGYSVLSELSAIGRVHEERIAQYYSSVGIRFLKRHLEYFGGYDLTEERFLGLFRLSGESNTFTRSIQSGLGLLPSYDPNEFQSLQRDITLIEKEIVAVVRKHLPDDADFSQVVVYLLFGIRGTSIVYGNEIAVDLCDAALYENGRFIADRLKGVLAHEIHHIAVARKFEKFAKRLSCEEERVEYTVIEGLISEGMAYFYITPYLIELNAAQWNLSMTDIEQKIEQLRALLHNPIVSLEEKKKANDALFDDSLQGYAMGYFMIRKLHEAYGPEAVTMLLNDFSLFKAYDSLR
jgi:hypothetical protein